MSLEGSATAGQVLKGRINAVDILTISAYGIAVKNGFKGTEEEWLQSLEANPERIQRYVNEYLEEHPTTVDTTLTKEGDAADAKATGDAIKVVDERIGKVDERIGKHESDFENPHKVTASQVGARPDTWMPTASQVGARPDTWTPTAAEVGAVTSSQVTNMINDALGVIENGTY